MASRSTDPVAQMVIYLCLQTGITEDEAKALIRDLGIDRNSLLREARAILRTRLAETSWLK